jgi:hypothetical protein
MAIGNEQLPALYRSVDAASIDAQRRYLRLVRADLTLIVIGAGLTAVSVATDETRNVLAILGAIVLLGGVILTGVIGASHQNRNWFAARAAAESVKTVSWRYMMCAEPYLHAMPLAEAETLFCRRLTEVLREKSAIAGTLGGEQASGSQITDAMREIRKASLPDRIETYVHDRIQGQKVWYATKSKGNSTSSRRWIAGTVVTQMLAVVGAIALVRYPTLPVNLASVFSALAAALLAWLQMKQHQELANSYGLAAHELGLIETRAVHISTEEQFSGFVADAENAISREHTMWTARRDVPQ